MLSARRLLLLCLAVLLLAAPADAARKPKSVDAPTGLHAFLLRADEPRTDVFARTPSFAWNPVAGALRYEFQLSTSSLFRDSAIVHENEALTSPAASVPVSLPWTTGSPHSLFARVRAVTAGGTTTWSKGYGFSLRWPTLPTPIETYPGLLRWTPVEGATGYTVWWLFPNGTSKQVTVHTNVIDEREWYTFHQGASFSGKVKWRIRAVRHLYGSTANGLPRVSHGPWSPIYTTTNPTFAGGALKLLGTASDVVSTPGAADSHRLAPAFLFSGNTGLFSSPAELYRVYVFTDRDCINRVFTGALVGSPAYAPRIGGPLALPTTPSAGRTSFLLDGVEPRTYTFDDELVDSTEEASPAAPYAPATKTGDPTTGTGGTAAPTTKTAGFTPPTNLGAPVDFWDVDWERGARLYWTVIPVAPRTTATLTLVLDLPALSGDKSIAVASDGVAPGDVVTIGQAPSQDRATVVSVNGHQLTLSSALTFGHAPGETVVRAAGGSSEYQDLELAQEACAAGRVSTFGKSSEPVVAAAAAPYVSGLSTKGRLISAASRTATFYGTPLVAWAPALGAGAYEVQWSKTKYPFRPAATPLMTYATSATLPLTPGTWYYRVRGVNFFLPTGAQPMSWSDPVELTIAKPTFVVVGEQ